MFLAQLLNESEKLCRAERLTAEAWRRQ